MPPQQLEENRVRISDLVEFLLIFFKTGAELARVTGYSANHINNLFAGKGVESTFKEGNAFMLEAMAIRALQKLAAKGELCNTLREHFVKEFKRENPTLPATMFDGDHKSEIEARLARLEQSLANQNGKTL